jgi:microcystin-dependent protein
MDPILGQIILWPLNWVPAGWMACEGQELSVQQYTALYSLLGQTYGGNGTSTFKLPNLAGRVAMGSTGQVGLTPGSSTSTMTATGTGSVTLQANQVPVPAHTHSATFTSTTASSASVSVAIPVDAASSDNNVPGSASVLGKGLVSSSAAKIYSTAAATTTLKPFTASAALPTVSGTVAVGAVNTSTTPQAVPLAVAVPVAMSTVQPSFTLRYIIAVEGMYPVRP